MNGLLKIRKNGFKLKLLLIHHYLCVFIAIPISFRATHPISTKRNWMISQVVFLSRPGDFRPRTSNLNNCCKKLRCLQSRLNLGEQLYFWSIIIYLSRSGVFFSKNPPLMRMSDNRCFLPCVMYWTCISCNESHCKLVELAFLASRYILG